MKITIGNTRKGQALSLSTDKLTKHAVVLGATGSGKTGTILGLTEQVVDLGVPTILVDIKGDMGNVFQQHGALGTRMHKRLLTPGGIHGEQVNLFANIQCPEKASSAVSQLLRLCGEKNVDPLSSKPHAFLSTLLRYFHDQGVSVEVSDLIEGLREPPFQTFGALTIEEAFPVKQRVALAGKINNLIVAPSFELWRSGNELDANDLLSLRSDGKTNVSVYSIAHLDEEQRLFAITLLLRTVLTWMRKQPGSKDLRAMLVVDECAGLIPPHPRNPPTKAPLMLLLKQARAYGLGVVLSSQNPMDLDYKAMSNCETWVVGRLQMARDRARVVEAVASVTPHDRAKLELRISNLAEREFVLCRPKSTADFVSLDVQCSLTGPMTPMELAQAVKV